MPPTPPPATDSALTRCRSCLTPLYEGAKRCHHCGTARPKRHRIHVSRGGWLLAGCFVLVFGVGDTVYLVRERRNAKYADEGAVRVFVRDFIKEDWKHLVEDLESDPGLLQSLKDLRESLDLAPARGDPMTTQLVRIEHDRGHSIRSEFGTRWNVEASCYRFTVRVSGNDGTTKQLFGEVCVRDHYHYSRKILCFRLQPERFRSQLPACPSFPAIGPARPH